MKSTFKKTALIALSALLVFCAIVPVYALDGTDSETHIEYSLGVRETSLSTINAVFGKAKINISFVSGLNHLPQADYSCKATLTINYTGGQTDFGSSGIVNAMSASKKLFADNTLTVCAVDYEYFVNNTSVYSTNIN